jgi:hypothetical protein
LHAVYAELFRIFSNTDGCLDVSLDHSDSQLGI